MTRTIVMLFLVAACVNTLAARQKLSSGRNCENKEAAPIFPVKVVIVTTFENGSDTGDAPGEFQYWVERIPLRDSIPFPNGFHALRYNAEKQVLAICTGMGTARSASSVMALGMDSRFDLSKAYWIVAGIAGIDPEDGSTGSAAWAEWLVDGDLAYHIDIREIPKNWVTGYIPLGKSKPYEQPVADVRYNNVIHLNPALVSWAYNLTKNIKLDDNEAIKAMRLRYSNYPEAMKPPKVMLGDNIAAMTYWHGKHNNEWANAWVKYWTEGKGNFVTSAMEDTGIAQALEFMSGSGRVDFNRCLVLRTASNFTMQHSKITAIQSLKNEESGHKYSAYIPSLEAAYKVGVVVVNNIIKNWDTYKDKTPIP